MLHTNGGLLGLKILQMSDGDMMHPMIESQDQLKKLLQLQEAQIHKLLIFLGGFLNK